MTSPVLVTGSGGFVAPGVVAALEAAGHEVVTTDRPASTRPGHLVADLADAEQVSALLREVQPAVIVHLAGGPRRDLGELFSANVVTSVNLLNASARLSPAPLVLVAGSAAEYGDSGMGRIAADSPLQPASPYGWAKAAQSSLVGALGARYGIAVTVVRPFNIVSPLLGSATALGIRRQLLGQSGPVRTLTCGRLDVVRDYVPLEVVGRTFATLAAATARPEVVNVCSGVGIAIGEIVDAAAEVLGVSVEVTEDPQLAALPAPDRVVGDPGDLEALLGPLPTTSAASIAELLVG